MARAALTAGRALVRSRRLLLALGALVAFASGAALAREGDSRGTGDAPWPVVRSVGDLQRTLARRPEGRPIVLEFTADWCGACRALEATVFRSPAVAQALRDEAHGVRVDLTDTGDEAMAVAARFGVKVLPAIRFLDATGSEIPSLRLDGGTDEPTFRNALVRATRGAPTARR